MGSNALLALGAALVGFNLGKTARKKGFVAAGGAIALQALTGFAVYRVMSTVYQNTLAQTIGE
jgi:hypothetical protein